MTAPAVRGCVGLASWRSSHPKGRSASNEDPQGVRGNWADDFWNHEGGASLRLTPTDFGERQRLV